MTFFCTRFFQRHLGCFIFFLFVGSSSHIASSTRISRQLGDGALILSPCATHTRTHARSNMFRSNRTCRSSGVLLAALLLMLIMVVALFSVAAAAPVGSRTRSRPSFRCSRPFDVLDKFKFPTKFKNNKNENCKFRYMYISDATVNVSCGLDNSDDGSGSCYATVRFSGERLTALPPGVEDARYTLELRAVNVSTVNYKGFDHNGYSVCCALLDEAHCEWSNDSDGDPPKPTSAAVGEAEQNSQSANTTVDNEPDPTVTATHRKRVLRSIACPLYASEAVPAAGNTATDPKAAAVVSLSGSVRRPLHTLASKTWEARLIFYLRGEVVGRLSIPFQVTEADLAKALAPAEPAGGSDSSDQHPIKKEISAAPDGSSATDDRTSSPSLSDEPASTRTGGEQDGTRAHSFGVVAVRQESDESHSADGDRPRRREERDHGRRTE